MGKKKDARTKIPKKVLGFKISKGGRKDLGKLLKLIEGPEMRGAAVSAVTMAFGYLAEKVIERKGPLAKLAGKAPAVPQAN